MTSRSRRVIRCAVPARRSARPARAALLALAALAALASPAAAQLRVVTWNVTDYTGTDRGPDIQNIVYGVIPAPLALAGRSMAPDIIVTQEFSSATAVTTFRNLLNSATGSPGDWAAAPFVNGPDTDSAFFYRTSKVTFLGVTTVATGGVSPNHPRNIMRYDVRPLGYAAPSTTISFYSTHMKSQDAGTDDDNRRLLEAQRIRDDAELRAANGWNFIVLGDLNIQTSSEAAYVELVGSQANNAGRLFDPIRTPGSWNNNIAFRFVHTQEPTGTLGGMDDRLDQILVSNSLLDATGMDYIGNAVPYSTSTWNDPNHSYRAWGNDGSNYNAALATTTNAFVGPSIAQDLIDVARAGGHLPVLADFRVPPKITSSTTLDFGTVPVGSPAPTRSLSVANDANVTLWTTNGIANLSYSLAATAPFSAPAGPFTDAPGGSSNSHTISMSTATPGTFSSTLTITSNDPDQPSRTVTLIGTVGAANVGPTANAGPDFVVTDTDRNGSELVTLDASASTDPDNGISNYRWIRAGSTISTGPAPIQSAVIPLGSFTLTLLVTDPSNATSIDTVVVKVNDPPTANAGLDQTLVDTDNSGDETVSLVGSASDTDGSIINYRWTLGPTVLANGPAANNLTLPLPVGTSTLTLQATDSDGATSTDSLTITINPPAPCPCNADYDNSGSPIPDIDDITAFFDDFALGLPRADVDCTGDGSIPDIEDIIRFFDLFTLGCP